MQHSDNIQGLSPAAFLFYFPDIKSRNTTAEILATYTIGASSYSRVSDIPPGRVFAKVTAGFFLNAPPAKLLLKRYQTGGYYVPLYNLELSLSYDKGNVTVGITRQGRIGVDIESLRPGISKERLLKRYFSPEELGAINIDVSKITSSQFFWLWTRKEAVMKAMGTGLLGCTKATSALDQPGF